MPAPTASKRRKIVDGHALFEGLSKADLNALLSRARVEHYPAGHKIFEKGAPGRGMMAILRGSVKISAPSMSRELVLTILQPGEVLVKLLCSTVMSGPLMRSRSPIANCWSSIGENSSRFLSVAPTSACNSLEYSATVYGIPTSK